MRMSVGNGKKRENKMGGKERMNMAAAENPVDPNV